QAAERVSGRPSTTSPECDGGDARRASLSGSGIRPGRGVPNEYQASQLCRSLEPRRLFAHEGQVRILRERSRITPVLGRAIVMFAPSGLVNGSSVKVVQELEVQERPGL